MPGNIGKISTYSEKTNLQGKIRQEFDGIIGILSFKEIYSFGIP